MFACLHVYFLLSDLCLVAHLAVVQCVVPPLDSDMPHGGRLTSIYIALGRVLGQHTDDCVRGSLGGFDHARETYDSQLQPLLLVGVTYEPTGSLLQRRMCGFTVWDRYVPADA